MGTTNKKGNKPAHEIKSGHLKATIWLNDTESGPRHNVTLCPHL